MTACDATDVCPARLHRGASWRLGLLALALLLVSCTRPGASSSNVHIALAMEPSPPVVGASRVVITLQSASGTPITGAQLDVRGDMTHAGMVPVLTHTTEQGGGRYVASGFRFTMAGDWVLTVSGTLKDGTPVTHVFSVDGVGAAGRARAAPAPPV